MIETLARADNVSFIFHLLVCAKKYRCRGSDLVNRVRRVECVSIILDETELFLSTNYSIRISTLYAIWDKRCSKRNVDP
jgi:hypothetical protein